MSDNHAQPPGPEPEPEREPVPAPEIWVLICTYRRPQQLAALLQGLSEQILDPAGAPEPPDAAAAGHMREPGGCGQRFGVVVVDNAPSAEVADVVAAAPLRIRYLHQPVPGIATARNTALAAVPDTAQAVVFIDDDELPTPGWLQALVDTARSSGADAVAGPVLPIFEEAEPQWLASYGYVRRTDFPTGEHQRRLATNNTLVRAEWFLCRGYRFDEAFNFSGGEDSDLFERMLRDGARFYWCAEAVVTEEVPQERATKTWLRARAARGGAVRVIRAQRRDATRGSQSAGAGSEAAGAGSESGLGGESGPHRESGPHSGNTSQFPPRLRARLGAEAVARIGYGALRRFRHRLSGTPITFTDDYFLCEGLGMLRQLRGGNAEEYQRTQ